jgi:hypothetical protein
MSAGPWHVPTLTPIYYLYHVKDIRPTFLSILMAGGAPTDDLEVVSSS